MSWTKSMDCEVRGRHWPGSGLFENVCDWCGADLTGARAAKETASLERARSEELFGTGGEGNAM